MTGGRQARPAAGIAPSAPAHFWPPLATNPMYFARNYPARADLGEISISHMLMSRRRALTYSLTAL